MAQPIGSVGWMDLTVSDATGVRDFYREVVGWEISEHDMGAYSDFCVHPPGGDPVAGICHARGRNAGLPAQWLMYITVEDVGRSAARCEELGGETLIGPRGMGGMGRFAVIRDPAGAVAALFQEASQPTAGGTG